MDAGARPVRRPPNSCLSDWVAPCMRRFNSLMSKPGVGIILSPPQEPAAGIIRPADRCKPPTLSAGDNRAVPGTAQDRADRTRFGDREYDDRQRSLAGKRECCRIHHLVAALDRLRMRQAVETLGGRVFFGIG